MRWIVRLVSLGSSHVPCIPLLFCCSMTYVTMESPRNVFKVLDLVHVLSNAVPLADCMTRRPSIPCPVSSLDVPWTLSRALHRERGFLRALSLNASHGWVLINKTMHDHSTFAEESNFELGLLTCEIGSLSYANNNHHSRLSSRVSVFRRLFTPKETRGGTDTGVSLG